ncbi:60S ribosomal protein L24 [Artemisia annua]|uniref:60S ribosomal protein L24 n=1 Tax=Artemisia annua TaxID=35608 RepID=A0A2U1KNW5_ARTAN|nr:60S ribosomal protein L24 [Artemisia annua]
MRSGFLDSGGGGEKKKKKKDDGRTGTINVETVSSSMEGNNEMLGGFISETNVTDASTVTKALRVVTPQSTSELNVTEATTGSREGYGDSLQVPSSSIGGTNVMEEFWSISDMNVLNTNVVTSVVGESRAATDDYPKPFEFPALNETNVAGNKDATATISFGELRSASTMNLNSVNFNVDVATGSSKDVPKQVEPVSLASPSMVNDGDDCNLSEGFCSPSFVAAAAVITMVLKTELCRFSGQKIYPGRGIRFIRSDSQVFLFLNSKCKRYFHNKLKPSKLTWTAMYRKQHKKDIAQEAVKKRRRATKKPYSRAIVGATLEVIQKKRSEKPEVRDAAREAALRFYRLKKMQILGYFI